MSHDPHWQLQSQHCEFYQRVNEYTHVILLSQSTFHEDASCILHSAGLDWVNVDSENTSQSFWSRRSHCAGPTMHQQWRQCKELLRPRTGSNSYEDLWSLWRWLQGVGHSTSILDQRDDRWTGTRSCKSTGTMPSKVQEHMNLQKQGCKWHEAYEHSSQKKTDWLSWGHPQGFWKKISTSMMLSQLPNGLIGIFPRQLRASTLGEIVWWIWGYLEGPHPTTQHSYSSVFWSLVQPVSDFQPAFNNVKFPPPPNGRSCHVSPPPPQKKKNELKDIFALGKHVMFSGQFPPFFPQKNPGLPYLNLGQQQLGANLGVFPQFFVLNMEN